ncbi:hypothetical protein COT66_00450, partial [Candidatus Shapirobacteria bacterium CG09_land_8_20_14_0_10_49_15]
MNARLRQHYLQLWELADSLERDWWQEQEKASLRQTLRDAVATDANLASIVDITASNFLEQLTNRLQVLAVSQPEISQSNLPPAETLKQIQQTQNHLFHLPQETNFTFHHGKKGGPNVTDTELQTILTKHGLIYTNGKFAATINETDRRAAAQEISQKSTAHFHRQQLEKEITSLFEGQAPANLFAREFFGTPEGVPGVASFLAEKISQKSADYLGQRISAHQHGHFDPLAPNSQKALNRAVEETRDHIAANRLFTSQEQATIGRQINAMITSSPKFRLLTARNQQLVLNRVNETLGQISSVSQTPSQIISFKVRATKHGRPALTSFQAGYRESERKTKKFEAIPNRPQNVVSTALRAAGRGLNSPEVQLSTRNISRNISDFSRDPFGATLRYPYYSLVYLLPKPITDLFLPSKDSLRSKVKLIYGVSISPDAQRQLLENFGKNILKSIGSKVGFYTRDFKSDYHFAPVAALGWVSDKAFTGLGEGVGWVFGKIPGVGKTLKESISRSVGSKRNRQKSLLTSWMVSLPLALLKLVPGGIWALAKKIPFVAKSWANLSVSTKLSLFKFLRIGKGVLGSLSKALPHGLISGGLGYLATGNPLAGGGLGLTDLTFHFLRNLGQVTEIGNWAVGAHTTIFGKAFGFAISNRWFYLPIKGSLAGLLVSQF